MSKTSARVQRNIDFFRSTIGNSLPNGVNDYTEGISHDGVIHIGAASGNFRSEHLGIVTYEGNGTFQKQVLTTKIPVDSIVMPKIILDGYGYGDNNIIHIETACYVYNVPSASIQQPIAVNSGSVQPLLKLGYNAGFLVLEIDWVTPRYFYRYAVNAICAGNNGSMQDAWFEDWTIANTDFATIGTVITQTNVPYKSAPVSNRGTRITQNLSAGANTVTHNLGLSDPRTITSVRLTGTGENIEVRVTGETANTLIINSPVALTGAEISIIPITL